MDKIKELLAASGADDYEIEEVRESGWEFYFIRHKLDQNRAKDITSLKVKVYKKLEEGKYLGSASGIIPPTAAEEEAKATIENLVYQAGLVKNPYYELNGPEEARIGEGNATAGADATAGAGADATAGADAGMGLMTNEDSLDIQKTSKDFIETFAEIPETETEFLNSYEIFVSKKERRFANSRGIDIEMVYPTTLLEVVTNARSSQTKEDGTSQEIELYRLYSRGTCDKEALTNDVTELLRMGKDRLEAVLTPNINKAPLILSTQDAVGTMSYFLQRVSAGFKYQGLSDWEIGKPIAEGVKGDKITLTVLPFLPNSSQNFPFDEEGAAIKERILINENVPENYWGTRQFSQYMGLKESSMVYNYRIDGGSKTAEELRSGPYLEVVEFSGFDCDPITGDIAGEIRLGYYHDGDKLIKVTGGSVSGSMTELLKELYLSKELRQYNNALIPSVIRIENVTVAGAEK